MSSHDPAVHVEPKQQIPLESVTERVTQLALPDVDAVVAIERGGLTPGTIVASHLDRPLGRIRIRYRDDLNSPIRHEPELVSVDLSIRPGDRILLVDDVSVTGATMRRAAEVLAGCEVLTMTLKGEADFVAFPDLDGCVMWPWSPQPDRTG